MAVSEAAPPPSVVARVNGPGCVGWRPAGTSLSAALTFEKRSEPEALVARGMTDCAELNLHRALREGCEPRVTARRARLLAL